MHSTLTAVLERNAAIHDDFCTEPYEMPWAAEARFFVQTLEGDDPDLAFHTQVSPDGLHWCDLDEKPHRVGVDGLVTWSVDRFGQWLRLRAVTGSGDNGVVRARIYVVGKG